MIKLSGRVSRALKISKWLKDKGYKHGVDFSWRLDSANDQIVITCKNQKMETLIALQWSC